jgi:hypothetical protein
MSLYTESLNQGKGQGLGSLDATIERLRNDKATAEANQNKLYTEFYGLRSQSNFLGSRSRSVAQAYMSELESLIEEQGKNPSQENLRMIESLKSDATNFLAMASASRAANLTELKTASSDPESYVETLDDMMTEFTTREEGELAARWDREKGQMVIDYGEGKTGVVYDDAVYGGSDPLAFTKRKVDAVPPLGQWGLTNKNLFTLDNNKEKFLEDFTRRFVLSNGHDKLESPYVNAAIVWYLRENGANLSSPQVINNVRNEVLSNDEKLEKVLSDYGRAEGEKLYGILSQEAAEEVKRLKASKQPVEKKDPPPSPFGFGVDSNIPPGLRYITSRKNGKTTYIDSQISELYHFDKPIRPNEEANFRYLIVSANVDVDGSILIGYVEETEDLLAIPGVPSNQKSIKYQRLRAGDDKGLYSTVKNKLSHMYDPLFKASLDRYNQTAVSENPSKAPSMTAPGRTLEGGGIIRNAINSVSNFFTGK